MKGVTAGSSRAAFFLFLLLALAAPAAEGQDLDDAGGTPVVVHALSLERSLEEKVVVAEGAVDVTYGDLRLRADRVVINEETKDLIAEGNVIMDDGESRLQGEHLEVNLDTRTGFVEDGQGFAEPYFFSGRRIEKSGRDRYRIFGSTFTTCEGDTPDWKFRSPDTLFLVDQYATSRHPSMWVKKIPVFYFPYAAFPLSRKRATGLLIPEVRVNEIEGWIVKNAFYWAPRDNFDATIGIDWYQNLGWGPSLETRYITAPGTFGRLEGRYISEDDGGEQWKMTLDHQHALPYGIQGQVDLFFLSDREDVRQFEDTLEGQATEKIGSSFFLSRTWSHYDVVFSGRYEESLLSANESTLTRFPELTIDRTQSRVGSTDLFWRLSLESAYLKSEGSESLFVLPSTVESQDGSGSQILLAQESRVETARFTMLPEISWPKSLGSWGSLTPSLAYSAAYYSEDLEGEAVARGIPLVTLGLDGPKVSKIVDLEDKVGRIEKLKHLIEPRINYVYTPEEDQSTIPQFDLLDFIPARNRLVYSLTNTIMGKVASRKEGEKSRTDELLRVKLTQTYDFDAPEIDGETQPFSPLVWDVLSSPGTHWKIRWKGKLDFYREEIGSQDLSLRWQSPTGTMLQGEWRTSRGGDLGFVDLWALLPLKSWHLDLRSRYNVEEEEFIENHAFFKYSSQCWDISSGVVFWPGEYEFRLQFGLKGIGTVFNMGYD
jgi:LPS-assembly protein